MAIAILLAGPNDLDAIMVNPHAMADDMLLALPGLGRLCFPWPHPHW